MDMNKQCFKCHKTKSLTLFYRHKRMSDGHLGKCKDCTKHDAMERYNSPEGRIKVAKYEKLRFQTPHRKAMVRKYAVKRRIKFPGKAKCNRAVSNALRDKRLIQMPCEICGDTKVQAHHEDYRSPLKVRWMCFKHHREIGHGQKVGHSQPLNQL